MTNTADLYQPIHSNRTAPPPLIIRAVVSSTQDYVVGGMPSSSQKVENYVLISALPKELQERVKTSIQAIISGM